MTIFATIDNDAAVTTRILLFCTRSHKVVTPVLQALVNMRTLLQYESVISGLNIAAAE